jgi:hypothetical protein
MVGKVRKQKRGKAEEEKTHRFASGSSPNSRLTSLVLFIPSQPVLPQLVLLPIDLADASEYVEA